MLDSEMMSCATCDYINSEILRKAKEVADALVDMWAGKRDNESPQQPDQHKQ